MLSNEMQTDDKYPKAFAGYIKNDTIRSQSSSGGFFTALAEYVIEQHGVVFGAAFNDEMDVVHIAVEDKEELYRLRGSKYVQSNMGKCLEQIKKKLDEGRLVLFSGTPCQVAGINSALGGKYDNLILVDIICHGTPAPEVWRKYLQYQEKIYKSQVVNASFRDKTNGWEEFSMALKFENGQSYISGLKTDLYLKAFLENLSLRKSCYNCSFKTEKRVSDLTIGDFWGVKDVAPNLYDAKGVSLVLAQSEKGEELLRKIEQGVKLEEVDTKQSIAKNGAMVHSVYEHSFRDFFYYQLRKKDFKRNVDGCLKSGHLYRIKRKIFQLKTK